MLISDVYKRQDDYFKSVDPATAPRTPEGDIDLESPLTPWELWDAMEKVRLQTDDILYMEIEEDVYKRQSGN